MPVTNLPGGVSSFGVPILGGGGVIPPSGTVFWVNSSAAIASDDANAGSLSNPFKTLNFAYTKCTANVGDTVIALPGHVETVSVAGGVTANVAGVTTIFLGNDDNRPNVSFTATAATFAISGANQTFVGAYGTTTVDQIVSPFVISAAGVSLDLTWEDLDATHEALRAVLTTAAANRLKLNLRYRGFIAGTHVVNAVRLVGGTGARVNVDFYGKASVSGIVEFSGTLCTDVQITGLFYHSGTTDGSRNVKDTITGSLWSVDIFDAAAGMRWTGGSASAPTLGSPIGASSLNVPGADVGTNTLERDVIGNKSDATIDVVGTTKTLMAYAKGLLNDMSGSGIVTYPTAAAYANSVTVAAVLGYVQDGVRRGTGTILPASTSLYDLLAGTNGIPTTFPASAIPAAGVNMAQLMREIYDQSPKGIATTAATITLATVSIFTITGGPIEVESLYAIWVTTAQAVATTLQFNMSATVGGATALSLASASQSGVAAGTSLLCTGTFGAGPTVTTAGTVAAGTTKFICPVGSLQYIAGTSANTGTVQWFLRYKPLARGVVVAAAF